VQNICEEFWHFNFVFILAIILEPYPNEAPERSLRIDHLQLPPSTKFPLHCFYSISIKSSGLSLEKNVDYDKDVLIFYN
jgi:hypothetical protein